MVWSVIVTLILIGIILILLEVLVIPGFGVAGILGMGTMVVGIYGAYENYGSLAGHYTLAATLVLSGITAYFTLKSKTWKRIMLNQNIDSKTNVIDTNAIKIGDTGITISRLAPMGKAFINNEYYEVSTYGQFIDQNTEIEVIKIEGNKIFVKLKS